ncbi:alpha-defensin 1-like [Myotis daubentonii]|uniref:alpha-defensin 1-like n=1 Tax=Myotis daubentonii TaxID=98922 RepID=UPI002873BD13|nr:alpha-defensin 1-like [Myotis daubentonii]
MRTLTLFAAFLLLVLQAQAQTLQETADQVPAQDQPETKDQGELWAEDQDQAEDSDQDVAISFTGEERLTRAAGRGTGTYCFCTLKNFCNFPVKKAGSCWLYGRRRTLCCR